MTENPIDPKLRKAMAEVLEIIRKYDIAGHVVLCSRENVETRIRFPTWSVAQYEEKGGRARIHFRAKTGVQSPEDVAHTRNALNGIAMESGKLVMALMPMIDRIDDELGGDTKSGPFVPAPPWDYR